MASAVAATSAQEADLLGHCSDLKRRLVNFARSQRFSRQLDRAVRESLGSDVPEESEFINLLDHFILQRPLAGGRTVVEAFVSARPGLSEADRTMLLGWRDVVEGVFEVCQRDGDAIIARNLIDELTYRISSNAGPGALAPMQPARFMIARIVPVGDGWMLSGTQQLFRASQRAPMLHTAAELARKYPRLVFRNPAKVAQGWELQRKYRARFIEFFGTDLIVVPGPQVAASMDSFLEWYTHQALVEAYGEEASRDQDTAALTPALDVPDNLALATTVGLICDETEGLTLLTNFQLVQEAFDNPGLADTERQQAVLGYLREDSISTLPFRRLAGADTGRASQLFQRLLRKPGFSWERDGEALLRKHKPHCFGTSPHPRITPLREELAKALPASRSIAA